nr:MAG TPA: hypothetical protein [Caudoviricetes sp.]
MFTIAQIVIVCAWFAMWAVNSKMFRNEPKRDQNHMINAMLDTGCVILLISLLVRFVES